MGDPRTGWRVDGYEIEGLVGRGGMGVVYRARHLHLERRVALKLLAPELAEAPGFRERFLHEARVAAHIAHPAIVTVYDAGDADGVLWLAMHYVEGTGLAAGLERRGGSSPSARSARSSRWRRRWTRRTRVAWCIGT